ncbi:unnamed protein product [Albugo candida]|uniref:Uncharacterized protein n=1 Tax=Albugo candida TaxID=65357 RepID=A0A024GQQ1_9STRA|nr:unnamed protein product [Albugo candida]|eukprot:CCI49042.1 unnamed protein product [Albugo candida]
MVLLNVRFFLLQQNARLWPDNEDKAWKTSVMSNGFEILVHTAKVAEGIFGAYMEVSLVCFLLLFTARRVVTFFDQINDGPVTMMVDSKDRTPGKTAASKA